MPLYSRYSFELIYERKKITLIFSWEKIKHFCVVYYTSIFGNEFLLLFFFYVQNVYLGIEQGSFANRCYFQKKKNVEEKYLGTANCQAVFKLALVLSKIYILHNVIFNLNLILTYRVFRKIIQIFVTKNEQRASNFLIADDF